MKSGSTIIQVLTSVLALGTLVGVAHASPGRNPNSQRYSQKNPSAATGRSGTASLSARSLLGKDGKTIVDVTTGTIDSSAAAPGFIAKVLFKAYRSDETVAFTRNFSGMTTPTQQYTFTNMVRSQALQVQGNIRGIDGKRTDVVTVSDVVRLRPDLGVGIDMPSKAKVDTIVGITGSVVEANGDTGATTDCVLYVDDVEADRANGIWVDSGDTVSCAFNYKFTTTGTHAVRIEAANVVPGDWDTANNKASASIEIVSAETNLNYWFGASHDHYVDRYLSTGFYQYNGAYSATNDYGYEHDNRQDWTAVSIQTYSLSSAAFPLTVTARESSDGIDGISNTITVGAPDWSYTDGENTYGCAERYADGFYFYMCSHAGSSATRYERYGGKVTYFSRNWSYYWDSTGGLYEYSYNYAQDSQWGMPSSFGNTVALAYQIDAANGTFTASPEVTLANENYYWWYYQYNYPLTCSEYQDEYYTQKYCYEREYSYTRRYGSTFDDSN